MFALPGFMRLLLICDVMDRSHHADPAVVFVEVTSRS